MKNIKKCAWLDKTLVINPLSFCLCQTVKQFHEKLKYIGVPRDIWPSFTLNGSDATTHFFFNSKRTPCAIVTIKTSKKMKKKQHLSLLAHEAVHIWQEIREMIGERSPSSEFEAYAIQGITQQLFISFKGKTK